MNRVKYLSLSISILLIAGCSGVKNLKKAELNLPDVIMENQPVDSLTLSDLGWWEFYGDEYLRDIIQRTLENNKRLQIAAAKVEQAHKLYNVDKAKLFPELYGLVPFNHETNDYYKERYIPDPELGIKASIRWEADLWGSLTWAKRKSGAQFLATVEDQRAMRMILVSEAASAYFRLVALDNELEIVKHTMTTRKEGVELARIRYEGGLTSETVYQQAKVQYATAAALIPRLEYNIELNENVLALLMGCYPDEEIKRSKQLKDNTFPDRIPIGLPSQLLERRPDVRASELRLESALDGVGVSWANRFPKLTIELTGGVENDKFKGLLRSPFSYVAENFVAPIVDFGRRKNNYKAAVAAYEEARLGYEQKVLEVFKEVVDAVNSYSSSLKSVELNNELLVAADKYQDLTWKQYRAGTINYIDVLDAQRRYLEAQIALSNAHLDEHLALVNLYKVLGGGWQINEVTSD